MVLLNKDSAHYSRSATCLSLSKKAGICALKAEINFEVLIGSCSASHGA
jgi:hypothetical protein